MFTKNKVHPGKFEGNESIHVAKVLYSVCNHSGAAEELDFSEYYTDWYARIDGTNHIFIVHEDNNGFFTYGAYNIDEGESMWEGLCDEYYGYWDIAA